MRRRLVQLQRRRHPARGLFSKNRSTMALRSVIAQPPRLHPATVRFVSRPPVSGSVKMDCI